MALFEGGNPKRRPQGSPVSAFVIEAVLLILFLAASLAVVMSMLSISYRQETQAVLTTRAMSYAIDCAERFVIEPEGERASYVTVEDGMTITCDVTSFQTAAGVMCYAHITVSPTDAIPAPVHPLASLPLAQPTSGADPEMPVIFELDTARYISKVVR